MLMLTSRQAFVFAAGAILFYQLILPPVVGLADNGDFGKVIGRFDLYARVHRTYEYVDTVYQFRADKHWVSDFISVEIPLARLSIWLNSLLSKDGNFDLRAIGVVHGALFLLALWLFAPLLADARPGVRWAIYILVLLVYCDVMYVNSLNSFYMDEPAYLFLLLTAVLYLRVIRWGRRLDALLLILCPLLLVSAKAQHALVGLWIAILFFATANVLHPVGRTGWYAAGVGLILAAALMMWKGQDADYTANPLYNITFEEILPHSRNVDRTLADLGLDDSFRFCIGKKAYVPGSGMEDPAFRQRFIERLSFGKLAVYYARHPAVAYRTLRHGLSIAGEQHAFGNFDVSTGFRPSTESKAFAFWSELKRHFFLHRGPPFLFTFLVLVALLCILLWFERKSLPRGALPAGFCLMGAAFTEMGLSTLCDSMDITRHSLIFLALFDMVALACAYLAIRSGLKAVNGWKSGVRSRGSRAVPAVPA